jgi:hypothetical protein
MIKMHVNPYQSPTNATDRFQTQGKPSLGIWRRRLATLGAEILFSAVHAGALLVLFVTLLLTETDRIEGQVEPFRSNWEVVGAAVTTVLSSPGIWIVHFTFGTEPLFELVVMASNSCLWGFGAVGAFRLCRRVWSTPPNSQQNPSPCDNPDTRSLNPEP